MTTEDKELAAAAIGFQLREVLTEMLDSLPLTALDWAPCAGHLLILEVLHWELSTMRAPLAQALKGIAPCPPAM
jgi:hypothetical protein